MDAALIPRYLLEQVRDLPWAVDEFYRQWRLYQGPLSFLYAVVDEGMMIKGVLWFSVMPMTRALQVALLSLDKCYQGQGYLKHLIIPFLKDAGEKLEIDRVIWHTSGAHTRAFERLGFQRSNYTMMEGFCHAV